MSSFSRKWWFLLAILVILWMLFAPPYASKGLDWTNFSELAEFNMEIQTKAAFAFHFPQNYQVLKIIPIVLVLAILFLGNRVTHIFSFYVAANYLLIAFFQNIGLTEKYGLGIITSFLIPEILISVFWFWEAFARKNDFTPVKQPLWKYWMVPLAFIAFWYPMNTQTGMPDFNPTYLYTNFAGLAFSVMTPLYLSILTFYYPKVNIDTMRITSLVGTIVGIRSVSTILYLDPSIVWWNVVLHIPLLTISFYALVLSLREPRKS